MEWPQFRFAKGKLHRLVCPPDRDYIIVRDELVPTLGCRVTRNQVKSFIHLTRPLATIGRVSAWDITSDDPQRPGAREEARRRDRLLDQGIDPKQEQEERVAAQAARKRETTRQSALLRDGWTAYLEAHRAKWGPRHYTDHERLARPGGEKAKRGQRKTTPGPLASLLKLEMRELDRDRLAQWMQEEAASRPTQARLAFGTLRAFVNWLDDHEAYRGIIDPEIFNGRTVRASVPEKRAKRDCLERGQLPAWFAAVRDLDSPVIRAYLQVLLLTGARREELAGLAWDHVNFKWGSLTIRDKVEGERTIPMTPYVRALMLELKRRNEAPPASVRKLRNAKDGPERRTRWAPSPWVFASPTAASGRLTEPRLAHDQALRRAEIPDLTLHGLRRSFGTLAEWVECPAGIVAQIMGHKPSATAEKHYRVRPLDLLRVWHEKIEAWILAEAGVALPAAQPEQPELRAVGA